MNAVKGAPGIWVETWWKESNNLGFEIDLEIKDAPKRAHIIYWGHQFGFTNHPNGGYFGLQIVNTQKVAMFSIWDAKSDASEENCTEIYENGPVCRCLIKYDWKLNQKSHI